MKRTPFLPTFPHSIHLQISRKFKRISKWNFRTQKKKVLSVGQIFENISWLLCLPPSMVTKEQNILNISKLFISYKLYQHTDISYFVSVNLSKLFELRPNGCIYNIVHVSVRCHVTRDIIELLRYGEGGLLRGSFSKQRKPPITGFWTKHAPFCLCARCT